MKVESYAFYDEGIASVYENEKWIVSVKNWEPSTDLKELTHLERHNLTERIVVLLYGSCTIIEGDEKEQGIAFKKTEMEPLRVYKIPKALWHKTLTRRDTKLLLIEEAQINNEQKEFYTLNQEEIKAIQS